MVNYFMITSNVMRLDEKKVIGCKKIPLFTFLLNIGMLLLI